MPAVDPRVILRLGSHAEKEYIEKTLTQVDGLILGANLMESTPGATSSLIFRCSTVPTAHVAVYLDPMTYAFGPYYDSNAGKTRTDLDWIKSEQKVKGGGVKRDFKKSYRALAKKYGGIFQMALAHSRALSLEDLADDDNRRAAVGAVIDYQLTRAKDEFQKDPEFATWADDIPLPSALFAPYFYIEPSDPYSWLAINVSLAEEAIVASSGRAPVHALLCLDDAFLTDDAFIDNFAQAVSSTGVAGVWLWFSKFREEAAALSQLRTFRKLVEALSESVDVFDLHGGFFSLALSRVGLRGISHGVGYGEQKDVMPIIGQSTPTVRYYVPPLRVRYGVVEIERSFGALGISAPSDFFEKICGCVICRKIVGTDLKNFAIQFGARHYSTPASRRQAQTPAAAKLCRFHFLLSRFGERDWLKSASLDTIRQTLAQAYGVWGKLPAFENPPHHLERWVSALS